MANDKIQKAQKETGALLKKAQADNLTTNDIDQLREVLWFHEYRYYILNDPLIADY